MSQLIPRDSLVSSLNHKKTRALFEETCLSTDTPVLSLRSNSKNGLPSLRDLFLDFVVDDPSEATLAEFVFGDVEHWHILCECNWFKPHLEEWRRICDTKRKARAFKAIISEVEEGGRSAFSAAKYLIEEPWKDKRDSKTKKQVKETTDEARHAVSEDLKRLREEGYLQ